MRAIQNPQCLITRVGESGRDFKVVNIPDRFRGWNWQSVVSVRECRQHERGLTADCQAEARRSSNRQCGRKNGESFNSEHGMKQKRRFDGGTTDEDKDSGFLNIMNALFIPKTLWSVGCL